MKSAQKRESDFGGQEAYLFVYPVGAAGVSEVVMDDMIDEAIGTDREVILAYNRDRAPDEFLSRLQRLLEEEPEDDSDYSWWDQLYSFDEDGIESGKIAGNLKDIDFFEIWGGPLDDISILVEEFDQHSSSITYEARTRRTFDYRSPREDDGNYLHSLEEIDTSQDLEKGIDSRLKLADLERRIGLI